MGLNLCDRCVADCRHERNLDEIVIKCGVYKPPMTNADRIRAMSDEELAKFISIQSDDCLCAGNPKCDYHCGSNLCLKVLIDWLQQPAEEDT